MNGFLKNNTGYLIRLAIFLAAVVFAAGRICTTQAEIQRRLKMVESGKADKELCQRELDLIHRQLDRIEGKLDVRFGHN